MASELAAGAATGLVAPVRTETAEIILAAAALVPAVARLIDRCRTEPDPGCELARACGEAASRLCGLQQRLAVQSRDGLVDEVDALLTYQARLVTEASALAFRPRGPAWNRLAQRFGDGWGPPADALIELAARVQAGER
jgi:hypothetical protein